ncbi:MAG: sigma-70 family RNA polymerase sigma factor [Phycisphaeraceae bacterium]|nr:sigma-70 family RNA polymerase sigma factor [Phycisphaerales bacterium]QOJ18508.1 MAG: sigma-70 family RNA polymerase sigma factor [Phycisphaeraceae bacterium]
MATANVHSGHTTRILLELAGGDRSAAERLVPHVYDELRRLAALHLRREAPGHTLQATLLADEAFLKLIDQSRVEWKGRAHFMAVASQIIRRLLVDHARLRCAHKRGAGWERVAMHEDAAPTVSDEVDLLALDDELNALRSLSERQARVVELRFFGGLSVEEAAEVLEVSPRTVKGDWMIARAWLRARLDGKD